jgi:DNA-binding transcriptional MerR regulator
MLSEEVEVKLPDKIYFRIGEVSEYTGVKPYVLRYWESEFQEIQPIRRKSQRLYDRETILIIIRIKHMLYEQNFTIAGAKKKLREEMNQRRVSTRVNELLREILNELKSIVKEKIG